MLSKSLYCRGFQCPKMLWLDKNKSEVGIISNNESVLSNGTMVGELAKDLLGSHIDIKYGNLEDMINETNKYLSLDDVIITEASFSYNNNFCSVDLLKKHNNSYEIYEVKSSTSIHDIYLEDVSYQYYVLTSLGLNVTKVCIVYINSDYLRIGDLNLNELFIIRDVTDIAISKKSLVKDKICELNNYLNSDELDLDIDINCVNPYPCIYFDYCKKGITNNSVFDIAGMTKKNMFKLYKEGLKNFEDLINSDINNKYKEQIDFELNNKSEKFLNEEIKNFLTKITYPLYYLDFETFNTSIPMYDYTKPYMQIPFQYSLHYKLKSDGKLFHSEFIAERDIDPRRSLAESLIKDIPMNVCVMAYNMSFEKGVIKNLADLYPDLKEHLMNIYNNMVDLMIPFYKRYYYKKEMRGSYSIKYVLPALFPNDDSLNYHNLDLVHNGMEATNAYNSFSNLSLDDYQKLRKSLLEYCKLDTYAMVKIHDELIKKCK